MLHFAGEESGGSCGEAAKETWYLRGFGGALAEREVLDAERGDLLRLPHLQYFADFSLNSLQNFAKSCRF